MSSKRKRKVSKKEEGPDRWVIAIKQTRSGNLIGKSAIVEIAAAFHRVGKRETEAELYLFLGDQQEGKRWSADHVGTFWNNKGLAIDGRTQRELLAERTAMAPVHSGKGAVEALVDFTRTCSLTAGPTARISIVLESCGADWAFLSELLVNHAPSLGDLDNLLGHRETCIDLYSLCRGANPTHEIVCAYQAALAAQGTEDFPSWVPAMTHDPRVDARALAAQAAFLMAEKGVY